MFCVLCVADDDANCVRACRTVYPLKRTARSQSALEPGPASRFVTNARDALPAAKQRWRGGGRVAAVEQSGGKLDQPAVACAYTNSADGRRTTQWTCKHTQAACLLWCRVEELLHNNSTQRNMQMHRINGYAVPKCCYMLSACIICVRVCCASVWQDRGSAGLADMYEYTATRNERPIRDTNVSGSRFVFRNNETQ